MSTALNSNDLVCLAAGGFLGPIIIHFNEVLPRTLIGLANSLAVISSPVEVDMENEFVFVFPTEALWGVGEL